MSEQIIKKILITGANGFIGGALISGMMNPQAIPHKLVPTYGPTFLIGSVFMILSAVFGVLLPNGRALYYFAAMVRNLCFVWHFHLLFYSI